MTHLLLHNSVVHVIGCQQFTYRMPWKDQYTYLQEYFLSISPNLRYIGCHMNNIFTGAQSYADDIALHCPVLHQRTGGPGDSKC